LLVLASPTGARQPERRRHPDRLRGKPALRRLVGYLHGDPGIAPRADPWRLRAGFRIFASRALRAAAAAQPVTRRVSRVPSGSSLTFCQEPVSEIQVVSEVQVVNEIYVGPGLQPRPTSDCPQDSRNPPSAGCRADTWRGWPQICTRAIKCGTEGEFNLLKAAADLTGPTESL